MYDEIADLARTRLSKAFDSHGRHLMEQDRHIRADAAARGLSPRSGAVIGARQTAHLQSVRKRCESVAQVWADLIEEHYGVFDEAAMEFVMAEVSKAAGSEEGALRLAERIDPGSPHGRARRLHDAAMSIIAEVRRDLTERMQAWRLRASRAGDGDTHPRDERPRDTVTGLLIRGEYDAHLPAALARASASTSPLSLVVLDIDRFKAVNDTHGHAKGDAVLKGVASIVQAVSAHKGDAFRYGGEEFVLVLENHDLHEALAVAERIRRTVAGSPIEGLSVTLSAGVAAWPEHGSDAAALFEAADSALYLSKNRGRDLVQFAGEPAPKEMSRDRVPERKAATSGALTFEQRQEFRRVLLQSRGVEVPLCPRDGTPFDVHDATHMGSAGREFLIVCPDCGLQARLTKDA